jgi:hypothetical protein
MARTSGSSVGNYYELQTWRPASSLTVAGSIRSVPTAPRGVLRFNAHVSVRTRFTDLQGTEPLIPGCNA